MKNKNLENSILQKIKQVLFEKPQKKSFSCLVLETVFKPALFVFVFGSIKMHL